jgi:hypothetical protein
LGKQLVLLLALAGCGWGQAIVNSCANQTLSGTTVTCSLSVTAGNLVLCFGHDAGSAAYQTAIVSGSSSSFTAVISSFNNPDRFVTSSLYKATAASTTTETYTETSSGTTTSQGIGCYQISGSSLAVDASCSGHTAGAANTAEQCSASMTLTATDLILGSSFTSSQYTWTAGTSFTIDQCFATGGGGGCGGATPGAMESRASVSGSVNPGMTSSGNAFWNMEGVAIKSGGAAAVMHTLTLTGAGPS